MKVVVEFFEKNIVGYSFRLSTCIVKTDFKNLNDAKRYYESREAYTVSEKTKKEFRTAKQIVRAAIKEEAELEFVRWEHGILSLYIRYSDKDTMEYNLRRIRSNKELNLVKN